MQNLILFFLLLSTSVFSESALNIRKIVTQDYIYKPYILSVLAEKHNISVPTLSKRLNTLKNNKL